ncbi:cysteine desulfurase family protein [Pedobacter frigidisoli]|uniref:cysteine desulfurase family protein n=1 Tax=Pedobacter frigidisoli TaxID=2530455 RepID=UPI00292EF865|nr:cysteine desulfurase family protein [Pedobacter frigidisoli]
MNEIVYLDNAATTSLDPVVLEAMLPFLTQHYGNPSSSYSIGRKSKTAIEAARKKVADLLGVKSTSIYFTSGGTESNNTAIATAVKTLGCTHIITSPIEHHAVLNTVEHYCADKNITCSFVKLNEYGEVDYNDLELQLNSQVKAGVKCLVSLMHANNEIGTLLDLKRAGEICNRYGAIFHSDCVQTIGHYPLQLAEYGVHFASASGHKFHGPKGTGILYVSAGTKITPLIHGGGQERKVRAGTENVHGMIGFAKALELAYENYPGDQIYISNLNKAMRDGLMQLSPEISFNNNDNALYTVLSVNFPGNMDTDLLLAMLDQAGICASGGSACSSGDDHGSHVMHALGKKQSGATIRFSFSKLTRMGDIDIAITTLAGLLKYPLSLA